MSTKKTKAKAANKSNPQALRALCVSANASLLEAMAVIDRGGIELAFVAEKNGVLLGTLSDGDVRRAILRRVAHDKPGTVGASMRKEFAFVRRDVQRAEVLDIMRARGISQIPVLDEAGKMVGLHLLRELIGASVRPNRAVIMAGGKGVRLRPLTETVPKPMLPVAGRPILERIVLHLIGFGIREIFISLNYLGHVIEDHFGDGSAFGCKIRYLRERRPLGTGGALSLLPKGNEHPVLVMNGDLLTEARIDKIFEFHTQGDFIATTCLRPYQVEVPFGVADVRGNRLVGLREKPTDQLLINSGIYVLSQEALRMIPKNQDYPITQLFEECLTQSLPVGAHVLAGDWIDIGRPEELKKARGL